MAYYNELRKVAQDQHAESKKRKKERIAEGYKKESEADRLVVEGRACKLHKDVTWQADAAAQAALVPCHGRADTLVDRQAASV
jgi:Alternative splicing regulator